MENIEIQETVKIPGTNIILEKGDKIFLNENMAHWMHIKEKLIFHDFVAIDENTQLEYYNGNYHVTYDIRRDEVNFMTDTGNQLTTHPVKFKDIYLQRKCMCIELIDGTAVWLYE